MKFIFITGGVVSSLGKGVATASIGLILQRRGFKVTIQKLDPYINVDPGTMNPFQHGEVFVTEDGAETDLDLGHYERFLNEDMGKENNVTAGQVYGTVIEKERKGDYLGGTVQVVPHITDEIKRRIREVGVQLNADIVIVEVGGTVGDIESLPFLEAIRQIRLEEGFKNTLSIHLTLVPFIKTAGELKTKPTQHSVQKLREIGIQPDILLCRTDRPLTSSAKRKIGLFANLPQDRVIEASDVEISVYEVPLIFCEQELDRIILKHFGYNNEQIDIQEWENTVERIKHPSNYVKIAVCGKYTHLKDAYKSITEAFCHAGVANDTRVELKYVESEILEKKDPEEVFSQIDGILIPGGFGHRGIEGKINSITFAREQKVPLFGICLGLQLAVVEFARKCLGWKDANSTEFDANTSHPVIMILPEKKGIKYYGGTLRLGSYPCVIKENTLAHIIYKKSKISERHRHRYEVNPAFIKTFEENGLILSGTSPDRYLVEIIELKDHPFFIACQFHPEFKSRLLSPHPIFRDFVKASLVYRKKRLRRKEYVS